MLSPHLTPIKPDAPQTEPVDEPSLERLEALPADPREQALSPNVALSTRDLLQAFARFMETDIAFGDATEDTVRAYYREVKLWVQWCLAQGTDPARAVRGDIEEYRRQLREGGLSVATRSHKLSIVRRFYDAAVRHDLMAANPASGVRGGKDLTPPEERVVALTENALARLLAALPGGDLKATRDRAIISLMAIHGLRRVEAHRLDHEHVTWPDSEVDFESAPARLLVHGKGKKQRTIYLRRDTWRALRVYIEAKVKKGLPLTGALFVAVGNFAGGNRLSRNGLNLVVDRYLEPLALKRDGVSCHALRHTHATEAVKNGVPIEHLRDEMGHAHIETTSRYVRAVGRLKNNPANFIGPGPSFGEDE